MHLPPLPRGNAQAPNTTPTPHLYASALLDYGQDASAAVRAQHTHHSTPAGGVASTLTTTDELMDSMEDTTATVGVAQLLGNDWGASGDSSNLRNF